MFNEHYFYIIFRLLILGIISSLLLVISLVAFTVSIAKQTREKEAKCTEYLNSKPGELNSKLSAEFNTMYEKVPEEYIERETVEYPNYERSSSSSSQMSLFQKQISRSRSNSNVSAEIMLQLMFDPEAAMDDTEKHVEKEDTERRQSWNGLEGSNSPDLFENSLRIRRIKTKFAKAGSIRCPAGKMLKRRNTMSVIAEIK